MGFPGSLRIFLADRKLQVDCASLRTGLLFEYDVIRKAHIIATGKSGDTSQIYSFFALLVSPLVAIIKGYDMRDDMKRTAKMIGDYGLDAPLVIRNLIIAGIASIIAGIVLRFILASTQSLIANILLIFGLLTGGCLMVTSALMVWSSKVGKIKLREQLIDSLALRGTELVLDVGCGRGLLLIAAARRLTTGKALGIDLWQSVDQSGNHPETTLMNAQAEGVADRVDVKTGDMRELPFEDQTIDVVVSSLAIHNVPSKQGRAQAVREIVRVLKPNGQVALLDFQCTDEYIQTLRELGWHQAKLSGLFFQIFPPVRAVTGKKPG